MKKIFLILLLTFSSLFSFSYIDSWDPNKTKFTTLDEYVASRGKTGYSASVTAVYTNVHIRMSQTEYYYWQTDGKNLHHTAVSPSTTTAGYYYATVEVIDLIPPPPCTPVAPPPSPYVQLLTYDDLDACNAAKNLVYTHDELTCFINTCSDDTTQDAVMYGKVKADTDGDGVPDDVDEDDDGDGVFDIQDADHPNFGTCQGFNTSSRVFYPASPVFPVSSYRYSGESGLNQCRDRLVNAQIDSTYTVGDTNPTCEKTYCFIHYLNDPVCTETAASVQPSGFIYKSSAITEQQCSAFIGQEYIEMVFHNPPDCPNTRYCFLKPRNPDASAPSSPNPAVDSNSTSADNRVLADAANITNSHLADIKDKISDSNGLLGDILGKSNSLLTSSEDLNTKLSSLNTKTDKSLANQDLMNSSLSSIKNSLTSNGTAANTAANMLGGKLDTVSTNLDQLETGIGGVNDKLESGLFGDDPFANTDFTDDGSSTFGDLEGTATGALSLTEESNIFGLSSVGSSGLQTISFSFYGRNMTIFEPSMLNGFPMAEIRALFLFFFAITGFITVFRTV
ncbi:MAG: hypothetical protein FP820_04905 [Sulfurimonas sp.]|nr:hypothetical protein [Sulfurimonas sp.]MBU3939997.1 hypothetical protein [bacterium]MBU4025630.1 hypothetical protein [bacterium]MBU4058582.1 hypothetical protein [bacterium]